RRRGARGSRHARPAPTPLPAEWPGALGSTSARDLLDDPEENHRGARTRLAEAEFQHGNEKWFRFAAAYARRDNRGAPLTARIVDTHRCRHSCRHGYSIIVW